MAAAVAACLAPHRSIAQSTTTLLPDATVLAKSTVRFRQLTSFTRWDDYLGDGGSRNIGSLLSIDSLGTAQVPQFAASEADIRVASGVTGFRLNAGRVVGVANSRVVTAPLIVEYGLTSRLTLGVVVPLVETRTTLFDQLNPSLVGLANVGPNPVRTGSATAATQNAALVQSVRSARTTLVQRFDQCQATPSGTGCSALLAQQAAVQALVQSSELMANTLENLYGTDRTLHPGQALVPLDNSPAQLAIATRVAAIAAEFSNLLGSNVVSGRVIGAGGPAANADLQALFASVGRDTLRSRSRSSIGDISLGATFQLANSFRGPGDTTGGLKYRLAVNGTFRIGTGQPANRNRLFDVGTGYGQQGVEGGVAADVALGKHLVATAVGSYTAQLGTVNVLRVPSTADRPYPLAPPFVGEFSAGNVLQLSIIPRVRLAGYLSINGQYSMVRTGADQYTLGAPVESDEFLVPATAGPPIAPFGYASSTAQQVGIGFSYSTIGTRDRGPRALPFEVSYSHLETIAGSGGPLFKTSRDQIELKVYWKP